MLIGAHVEVYVASQPTDMRKSIDGLALAVQESFAASPRSGALFVFFNRGHDKVKLLWWDRHGFWLAYNDEGQEEDQHGARDDACIAFVVPDANGDR